MINPIKWLEDHPKLASNLAIIYAGVIFLISQTPTIPAPPGPGYMMYILHFLEYAGFGALLLIAVTSNKYEGSAITLAIVIGVFYGLSDEIHQHFVATRCMDAVDAVFDSLGSVVGAFSANLIRRI